MLSPDMKEVVASLAQLEARHPQGLGESLRTRFWHGVEQRLLYTLGESSTYRPYSWGKRATLAALGVIGVVLATNVPRLFDQQVATQPKPTIADSAPLAPTPYIPAEREERLATPWSHSIYRWGVIVNDAAGFTITTKPDSLSRLTEVLGANRQLARLPIITVFTDRIITPENLARIIAQYRGHPNIELIIHNWAVRGGELNKDGQLGQVRVVSLVNILKGLINKNPDGTANSPLGDVMTSTVNKEVVDQIVQATGRTDLKQNMDLSNPLGHNLLNVHIPIATLSAIINSTEEYSQPAGN